ncbi:MAG: hypothetical protein MUF48_00150 [Pirellulaceae bacterium]|jgi:hypothetical protein|nr:hypothetical protein [Pirellulaceae bacterium]
MKTRWSRRDVLAGVSVVVFVMLAVTGVTSATPPWKKLVPFRSVDADPQKSYWLTEDHGPWMIMATSFAGPGAEEQARTLVLELRQRYRVDAYMHKRTFDYTQPVIGRGLDKFGSPKRMRYQSASKFDEIAVLVGNYTAYDAPDAQAQLEIVKTAKPTCLDISSDTTKKTTTQRFIGLRELQRLVHADPEMRELGPMRRAFIGRNPLLPREYFVAGGIEPFVLEMNKEVEHSLLDNPGQYTVRVASFQGESYFAGEEAAANSPRPGPLAGLPFRSSPGKQLEAAADSAHRLTEALRQRGVEAYEFHDRFESIVTIGSFQSVGTQLPDGRLDLSPEVYQIMQTYGAKRSDLPQHVQGLVPRRLDGIPFDVQPMPVKVPRRPLGADYVAGS